MRLALLVLALLALAASPAASFENPDGPVGSIVVSLGVRPQLSGNVESLGIKIASIEGTAMWAGLTFPMTQRVTLLLGATRYTSKVDYVYETLRLEETDLMVDLTLRFVIGGESK